MSNPMKVRTRRRDGVTILEPRGKITIGDGDVALRDAVLSALERGDQSLLIDFRRVPRIDSSGLGELVAARSRAVGAGGEIKLTNLGRRVSDVVEVTQMHTVFDVFDSEDAAIASFAA